MFPLRPRSKSAALDEITQRATVRQLHRDVKAVGVFFVRVVLDDVEVVGQILQRDQTFHFFLAALPLGRRAAVGDFLDGTDLDVVVHAFEDGGVGPAENVLLVPGQSADAHVVLGAAQGGVASFEDLVC